MLSEKKMRELCEQEEDLLITEVDSKRIQAAMIVFDEWEAHGNVAIERGQYGVHLWVDGVCIGMIDLWYQSDEAGISEPYVQIVIDEQISDDSLVRIELHEEETIIAIDRNYDNVEITKSEGGDVRIVYKHGGLK